MTNNNLKNAIRETTKYIEVNGIKLEVAEFSGNSNLPTLIFLHEGLGCVDMWRDFPKEVALQTGFSVLVYSRQGYGRSDPCEIPRPIEYMHIEAQEVLPDLIKVANINDYVLIGHSDGGSISLIFSGGDKCSGLKGIITMAPHIFCEQMTVDAIEIAKTAFTNGKLRQGLLKFHMENVDCAFLGWNGAWLNKQFMKWNIENFLPNITVPQLIIQGEDDQYGTYAQVEGIENQSSGPVEICMLEDCGHSPYKEQKELSLKAIKTFLRQFS